MVITALSYEASGGPTMTGKLVWNADQPRSGLAVLIFPDAFGLGEHAIAQAERFACLGHVVLACDLHGEGKRIHDLSAAIQFVADMQKDPLEIRRRAQAAMVALVTAPGVVATHIVAVGYCFGGTMALELARSGSPIAATLGLHCGLRTERPKDAAKIRGKVLVCIGADDPVVSAAERAAFEDEMREGGVDWQLHTYGGVVHSFTDPSVERLGQPEITRYDASADLRSWSAIQQTLREVPDSSVTLSMVS
jgi:dienelactone hydrolase